MRRLVVGTFVPLDGVMRAPGDLTEDRYLMTREELEDRIAVMLGGRAVEQVVFGMISTGGSDDIQRTSELASEWSWNSV